MHPQQPQFPRNPDEQGMPSPRTEQQVLSSRFTPDEIAQLLTLRQYVQTHPEKPEGDAALRRRQFARWCVQHGWLTDSK